MLACNERVTFQSGGRQILCCGRRMGDWQSVHAMPTKGVFIATQRNSILSELNSTDPVEQRTAKSVVFLLMTPRPTNWVNCCSRCNRVDNSTSSWVQLSWVDLCCYKHPLKHATVNLTDDIWHECTSRKIYDSCDIIIIIIDIFNLA